MGKSGQPPPAPGRDSRPDGPFSELDEAERVATEEESDNGNEGGGDAQ